MYFSFLKIGKADFFWDYDEYYINNNIHEAGFLLRENLKKYPMPAVKLNVNNLITK
ncbi:MAG: hypothetical protein HC906_19255 [Bacteroidales bacterium]|nr:hypothetical protein [Bacteroidales bacterium]